MSSNMLAELIAGDTLDFLDVVPGYPATAGWSLKYRMAPRTVGAAVVTLIATAQGADYRVQAAPAITAAWVAGYYTWARWVEKTAARQSLGDGQLLVKPDPALLAAGYDGRSQARKALDDAKAAFAAWSPTSRRYKIGDREMEFNAAGDIIKLITYWEQQVQNEDLLAGRAERVSRRIYTRI